MAKLDALKASVADLTARVKRSTSVEAGVATLVQEMVAQNKALADRVANLDPDMVTQDDLDTLQKDINDSANALDSATTALASAAAYDPSADKSAGKLAQGQSGGAPATDQSAPSPSQPATPPVDKPKPIAGTSADERAAADQANQASPAPAPAVDPLV